LPVFCNISDKHVNKKKQQIYSEAQTENAKSMSYQGLSQHGINEKSVCICGRSAKQHGHIVMTKNKRLQVQSHVVFIMNEHFNNYNP
jgi:hypothetical protein